MIDTTAQVVLPVAQIVAAVATTIAAGIAGGAVWTARKQITQNHDLNRQSDAHETYTDYFRLCLENTELSSSEMAKAYLPSGSFRNLSEQMTKESERYLWFISYMLSACEKINSSFPERVDWKSAIKAQIGYHSEALQEVWPAMKKHYQKDFRNLVEEAIDA